MKLQSLSLSLGASVFLAYQHLACADTCKRFDLDFRSTSYNIDFDQGGLEKGDYITGELVTKYRVEVSAVPTPGTGYAPNNAARIFDTSATATLSGDLGNVLIIQESDTALPISNGSGGTIIFDFTRPANFKNVQLLNLYEPNASVPPPRITMHRTDDSQEVFEASELGTNSMVTINTHVDAVVKVEVSFAGPGAVSSLAYEICSCGAGGDPHFRTYDGTKYSYHGECDLVMARSRSFGKNLGLDLHVRTQKTEDWSFISSAVIRIGDDIFEYDNNGKHYLNGNPDFEFPMFLAEKYKVWKDVAIREKPDHEGELQKVERHLIQIELGHGDSIKFSLLNGIMYVRVDAYLEGSEGMMGVHGIEGMVGRDHEVVLDPNEMGDHWQVRDTEPMLFQQIRFPQHPIACTPPSKVSRRRLDAVSRATAEKACASIPDHSRHFCIEDVVLTGDVSMAVNYGFGEDELF